MYGDRLIRAAHHALVFIFVVGSIVALSAQTVVDPRYLEFNASPDHNTVSNGTPLVSSYALSVYPQGSSTAFATVTLGKPTPGTDGVIRVDLLTVLNPLPTPGVTYEARVTALGPGGATASGLSNTFSYAAPCAPSISPTSRTVTASAATGSVGVTAGAGCAWTAVSNAPSWLSLTSSASGSGNGSVGYSVAANTSTSQRSGSLTIAGQTFNVTQSGATPCTYAITPSSQSPGAGATTGSTSVTTQSGCSWTAASNTNWITVTSGASGSGNGTVSFNIAANPNGSPRSGSLTIAGLNFSVNQAAAACTFAISPSSQSPGAGATSGSSTITAPAGCAWTASSNSNWIALTGATSGTGNGSVNFNIGANTAGTSRTGTLTIAGQQFTVNQAGAGCNYALTSTSQSADASATSGSTSVTAASGCAWTAASNAGWISITSGASGSGNGAVNFSIGANSSTTQRTGTLTIAGITYTVTQAGAACTYSITPTSQSAAAGGATGSSTVAAPSGCAWTATSNTGWISVTNGASGSGNGGVNFSIGANSSTTQRTGTLTIAGRTYTVTQAGAACTYSITPTSQSAAAGGATGSSTVTAPSGCSWTATSNTGWISVATGASGSGSGVVNFEIDENPNASTRSGSLTIAGHTFSVSQAAAPCTYTISPSGQSVSAAAGTGSTSVTAPTGCAWNAASNAGWINITSGASGNGDGSSSFTIAANTTTSPRSGTLTIAGKTFTVNQAASGCSFSLSPTSRSVAATGGSSTTSVNTGAGCAWTATSGQAWLSVTGGATGSGPGTVSFTASANSGAARTGTITIGGQTLTVSQAAGTCTYTVSPTNLTPTAAGGADDVAVSTQAGCAWTAVSNSPWITITSGASGTGNGPVNFTVAENTGTLQRGGSLLVAGRIVFVTQGAGCAYSASPATQSLSAAPASSSALIMTTGSCSWTATTTSPWITLTTPTGTGPKTLNYSVSANTGAASRTGTIRIGSNVVHTVTQQGAVTPPSTPQRLRVVVVTGGSE